MRAERIALALLCALAAGPARAAAPVAPAPEAPKPAAVAPVAPAPAPKGADATADAELMEFIAEFSTDSGFVDPFALDKVGKAVDKEIEKLDAETGRAEKAAPPASKEDDDGQ